MLKIKTTPNLYGITLMGDYLDLNALYDSLYNYLTFYYENMSDIYPYHEYEYLLSLNYDIRHAFTGNRGIQIVENNASSISALAECIYEVPESEKKRIKATRNNFKKGNLYFSVEILYPMIFHYLISFENILEEEPIDSWFEKDYTKKADVKKDYTRIEAEQDRAMIRQFTSLIWTNLQSLIGRDAAKDVYNYFLKSEYTFSYNIYCDALIHCQLVSFPGLSRQEKLSFLAASLYEIIDSEDLIHYPEDFGNSINIYKRALQMLGKNEKKIFPTKEELFKLIDKYQEPGAMLYEDQFDKILEKEYGFVDDGEPDW